MVFNVDFEICTIIFMVFIIALIFGKKEVVNYQNKMFRVYILITFFNTCLDVITCYTIANYKTVPYAFNYALNAVFLAIQFIIPTIFLVYVYMKVRQIEISGSMLFLIAWTPCLIGVVTVLLNPLTNYIFYIDDTGYHHGTYHWLLYANVLFYLLCTIVYMFFNRDVIRIRQMIIIAVVITCALLPVLIQYFLPTYMLSGVGTALSVVLLYVTDQSQVIYSDTITRALNREAFIQHVNSAIQRNIPEQIFAIALDNFKLINERFGVEGGNELMRMFVDNLIDEYNESEVFRYGGDTFLVVLPEKTEGAKEHDRIRRIIKKRYHIEEEIVELSACICLLHTIHIHQTTLIQTLEHAIVNVKKKGRDRFLEVDEDVTEDLKRSSAIERALVKAVESGHFEVHYQPILDTHTGKFHSMEALARLNVYGYGYVSPEEFIRIAEVNGTILQIGLIVLDEVCTFISEHNLKEKGIEFVEVNLSVVQCMQDHICRDIRRILEKHNVSPTMINLEITESAAADSEEKLIRNMARMSLSDITFSLDDYGSGFSNINYIVDLPFSIVKLDKYIVWAAMKNVTSRTILEHTVAMFKAIHLDVVAEGVEDMEMAGVLTAMGVDYLQGFYFSRPVPRDQLLTCLEEEYLDRKLNPDKYTKKS